MPDRTVAGAVLAGGRSRRMGRPKPAVEVGGRPLLHRAMDALRGAGCDPVLVIGGEPAVLAPLGVEPVPDRWPGEGPVGGVLTALAHAGVDVVVVACDLPDLDPATVAAVVAAGAGPDVDVAVATTDRRHPTVARWNRTAIDAVAAVFATGERSMRAALDAVRTVDVPVDPAAVRNVNRPSDVSDVGGR